MLLFALVQDRRVGLQQRLVEFHLRLRGDDLEVRRANVLHDRAARRSRSLHGGAKQVPECSDQIKSCPVKQVLRKVGLPLGHIDFDDKGEVERSPCATREQRGELGEQPRTKPFRLEIELVNGC